MDKKRQDFGINDRIIFDFFDEELFELINENLINSIICWSNNKVEDNNYTHFISEILTESNFFNEIIINDNEPYKIYGWSNIELEAQYKKNSETEKKEIELPKYELYLYKIEYDLDGGTLSKNNIEYYTEEDTFILNNPIKKGYKFIGWTGTDLDNFSKIVTIVKGSIGDRKYKANWLKIYKIKYDLMGVELKLCNPTEYTEDDEIFLYSIDNDEYKFIGWTGTDLKELTIDVKIPKNSKGDRKYKANWLKKYKIECELNGGKMCKNIMNYYTREDTYILDSPIKDGYEFIGWTGIGIDKPTKKVIIQKNSKGDRKYIAHWEIIKYKIEYDLMGLELELHNPTEYTHEDEIYLNEIKKNGYIFIGWTGTGVDKPTKKVIIQKNSKGDRKYIAHWYSEGLKFVMNKEKQIYIIFLEYYVGKIVAIPSCYNNFSVTSIGMKAFENCVDLELIKMPDSIQVIGNSAFSNCEKLKNVIVSKNITNIGYSAFSNCKNLLNIDLPRGIRSIEAWTFYNCISLTNIIIPEGVINIDHSAFRSCKNLKSIELPSTLQCVGSYVFFDCPNLTIYCKSKSKFSDGWNSGRPVKMID